MERCGPLRRTFGRSFLLALFLFATLLIGFPLHAQAPTWTFHQSGMHMVPDDVLDFLQGPDGTLYLAGYYSQRTWNSPDRRHTFILALFPTGQVRWQLIPEMGVATSLALDPQGNLVVASAEESRAVLRKFASDGSLLLQRSYNPAGISTLPLDVAVDSAGFMYLAGYFVFSIRLRRFAVLKTDPYGNLLWNRGSPGVWDEARQIQVTPTGDVLVAGHVCTNLAEDADVHWRRLDEEGHPVAVYTYDGPGGSNDDLVKLLYDPATASVYLGGNVATAPGCWSPWVARLYSMGTPYWTRSLVSADTFAVLTDLELGPEGEVYVLGNLQVDDTWKGFVARVDRWGQVQWRQVPFEGQSSWFNDLARRDDRLYLTGKTWTASTVWGTVVQLDTAGLSSDPVLFTLPGALQTEGVRLVVDSTHHVFVAGEVLYPETGQDIFVAGFGEPWRVEEWVSGAPATPRFWVIGLRRALKVQSLDHRALPPVTLYDRTGRRVRAYRNPTPLAVFHHLQPGVYFVRIQDRVFKTVVYP